jgi:hypothetical protein
MGMLAAGLILFTIGTYSMTPESLLYKGLAEMRDSIRRWLLKE